MGKDQERGNLKECGNRGNSCREVGQKSYDGLDTWKGWMRGAGQEMSRKLKWKVNMGEEGLGLAGQME